MAAEVVRVDGEALAPGELRGVEAGERRIVLCHAEGRVYALEDNCPHATARLSEGRLEGALLECPLHGGKLDVRDGSPQRPPIRRPAVTYPVREFADGYEIQIGA